MKLVKNWRESWRWFSMWAMGAATAMQGAWVALPDDMRNRLPEEWLTPVTLFILVLGIAGRLVDQEEE